MNQQELDPGKLPTDMGLFEGISSTISLLLTYLSPLVFKLPALQGAMFCNSKLICSHKLICEGQ